MCVVSSLLFGFCNVFGFLRKENSRVLAAVAVLKKLYGGDDLLRATFYAFKALKESNGIVDDAEKLIVKYRDSQADKNQAAS